jgi:hypothetical protein
VYPSRSANSDPHRTRSHQPRRGSRQRLIRRGLTAAAVLASVATPLTLLSTQAGAQAVQGAEILNDTAYIVAIPPDNPGAAGLIGGGPITAGGVVSARGTLALTASLPGDPPGSSRAVVAFPSGTFTVVAGLGFTFSFTSINQSTCRYTGISKEGSTIVSGTGEFAAATGTFTVSSSWTGYFPPAAGGGCNFNVDAAALNVARQQAVGAINLNT